MMILELGGLLQAATPSGEPVSVLVISLLVGLATLTGTFVASVAAEKQQDRIKNSSFGALASGAIGSVLAVMKNEPTLLVVGVLGSALGALLGWFVSLVLSIRASASGRKLRALSFLIGGASEVRKAIDLEERSRLLAALRTWHANVRGATDMQRQVILDSPRDATWATSARAMLQGWLTMATEALNLVLGYLTDKQTYHTRSSIIVFGEGDRAEGLHWLSHSRSLTPHSDRTFGRDSIAYKVHSQELSSPQFTHIDEANTDGQDRGASDYKSFMTFRINRFAVMVIDWPARLEARDPYVRFAAELFASLAVGVRECLESWPESLALDNPDTSRTEPGE